MLLWWVVRVGGSKYGSTAGALRPIQRIHDVLPAQLQASILLLNRAMLAVCNMGGWVGQQGAPDLAAGYAITMAFLFALLYVAWQAGSARPAPTA